MPLTSSIRKKFTDEAPEAIDWARCPVKERLAMERAERERRLKIMGKAPGFRRQVKYNYYVAQNCCWVFVKTNDRGVYVNLKRGTVLDAEITQRTASIYLKPTPRAEAVKLVGRATLLKACARAKERV